MIPASRTIYQDQLRTSKRLFRVMVSFGNGLYAHMSTAAQRARPVTRLALDAPVMDIVSKYSLSLPPCALCRRRSAIMVFLIVRREGREGTAKPPIRYYAYLPYYAYYAYNKEYHNGKIRFAYYARKP